MKSILRTALVLLLCLTMYLCVVPAAYADAGPSIISRIPEVWIFPSKYFG